MPSNPIGSRIASGMPSNTAPMMRCIFVFRDSRARYLLQVATVAAPFTTDHLFFSILTSV